MTTKPEQVATFKLVLVGDGGTGKVYLTAAFLTLHSITVTVAAYNWLALTVITLSQQWLKRRSFVLTGLT